MPDTGLSPAVRRSMNARIRRQPPNMRPRGPDRARGFGVGRAVVLGGTHLGGTHLVGAQRGAVGEYATGWAPVP